jgi:hypothetical protein
MIHQKASLAKADAEISNAYPDFMIHTEDLPSHIKAYGTLLEKERITYNKKIAVLLSGLRDLEAVKLLQELQYRLSNKISFRYAWENLNQGFTFLMKYSSYSLLKVTAFYFFIWAYNIKF